MGVYSFIEAIPILYDPDFSSPIEFMEEDYYPYFEFDFIPESWYLAAAFLGAKPVVAVKEGELYLTSAKWQAASKPIAIPLKLSEFGEELENRLGYLASKRYLGWKCIKKFTWYHYGMSGARDGFAVYACEQNPDLRARVEIHQSMTGNYDDPKVTLQYHLASGIILELSRFFSFVEILEQRFLAWCALNVVL